MVEATKKQLIDFICANFTTSEGEVPTSSGLDVYKKDELAQLVIDRGAENAFDDYMNSLS